MTDNKYFEQVQQEALKFEHSLIDVLQSGKQIIVDNPQLSIDALLGKISEGSGVLSARLPQAQIALLYQLLQYQGLRQLDNLPKTEKYIHSQVPYHKITLKNPGIQVGEKYYQLPIKVENGLLLEKQLQKWVPYTGAVRTSLGLPAKISFVIMPDGEVRFGSGHYFLTGNVPISIMGAGVLRARNGKILSIINDSNHFRPTRMEFISSLRWLAKLDVLQPVLKVNEVPITIHQ